jgi:putative methionine-R-sulfoxide reductase with GAF domain
MPVVKGEQLVGVFTAYANQPQAFRESDRYVFEQVSTDFQNHLGGIPRAADVVAFRLQNR